MSSMNYVSTYDLSFRSLGEEHFIWLPLKDVPISEYYPVNSLEQPVLGMYALAEWSSESKFGTDEQKYLCELAKKYNEMGYFLFHYKNRFGIIGVAEYNEYKGGSKPGRATLFNAREIQLCENEDDVPATELKVIGTSLKLPWKGAVYKQGDAINWRRIYIHKPDLDWYE